ncbi:MAG: cell filamentation protein Fic [Piscirickettsiaceae bacterium CG_4_9_14_3_um_filter_43_564]|nr:Fic family protein [Thiomicrospira sp.]PIQ02839.1 MAG: cell filamentation protein Fic [Piscirickettsiaceae bacterium CG18_big_fil_WC_8_21_14_2_50_44_103]PIU38834.1 MAG: cell filamentation protein Fic [Piscirickettsiaceae bacterium CG07_land_8_20_14_0_80_44_28]PIW58261.1 MAG: cell filamentation protein Fic [Piscirickettsiaceae bacterium CG12_big_fil_rev_8_21_14_0_65_44_934]PIW78561.1 MAG: cell filamentation protein Fic [Piscirickettsiaceae bacterium CG_4_8_14_3_um_filter_44_38]PIX80066.1 MAG
MSYQPPFTLSAKTLNLIASISEKLGRLSALDEQAQALRLRRVNQIRTIQGSLAIEGNTLSVEQITAVLDGKPVIAPPKEVQEVKNALAVYEKFDDWHPLNEQAMLKAHRVLMLGLVEQLGMYRSGGVGVMSGKEVVHMAPPANQVPRLIGNLFNWLQQTDHHPLIASAVFHYEFEFIHPFADGNGRMGRLWQSLILAKWNPLFANLPIESLVYAHQADYYQAIGESTEQTDCAPFIEFMLTVIDTTLTEQLNTTPQVTPQVTPQAVIDVLQKHPGLVTFCQKPRSRVELQAFCNLKDREHFRKTVLKPLLEAGWLIQTLPDKPNSPKQKYICEKLE